MIKYLFERFKIFLIYVVELENYKMYTLYLIITTLLCLYSLGYKYAVYTIGGMPMTSLYILKINTILQYVKIFVSTCVKRARTLYLFVWFKSIFLNI